MEHVLCYLSWGRRGDLWGQMFFGGHLPAPGKCKIPLLDFYKVPSCHKEL